MAINYNLPPDPQNAVLKRIYPWDEYDITLVMSWLYEQARKTGFIGTFEDFKLRYGKFIEASDPADIYDIVDNYTGTYHITPLLSIEQVLQTKNKVLNQNIIIDPIPEDLVINSNPYTGSYQVTPLARVDQILKTNNRTLEDNIIVEKIPYHETDNEAGGRTVSIG